MRVSLAPRAAGGPDDAFAALPLLDPDGARLLLGGADVTQPIRPAADTLFGPRGACLAGAGGPLVACDTGHHRALIWNRVPDVDNAPADVLLGQPDFAREGRNAGRDIDATTLNVPTGVAYGNDVLAIADAWNHRVLLWHGIPTSSNRPADVVLGQRDGCSGLANRGMTAPRADTLHWCYGVMIHQGRLFVADTGNRRLLMWERLPTAHGTPADLVLGQPDFGSRDDNADLGGGAIGMRWPHGMAVAGRMLLVADAGLNRVMAWNSVPGRNGTPCDAVLGQADFNGRDHNRGAYAPTAATLNMPYGVAVHGNSIVVADTANSRLLGFDMTTIGTGAMATRLAAQGRFDGKGDNRWRSATRNSLCWPYAVAACETAVIVADSGNNRLLLWETAHP
jgi:hypothetical protein